LDAFHELSHLEGIIPALESAHAVAQAKKLKLPENQIMVVNLSGRGDKDVTEVMDAGWLSVIVDPTGAALGLWKPKSK